MENKSKIKKYVLSWFDTNIDKRILNYLLKELKNNNDFINILKFYYDKNIEPSINLINLFNSYKKEILDIIYNDIQNTRLLIEIGSIKENDSINIYGKIFEIDNNRNLINKKFTTEEKEILSLYSFDRTIEKFYCDINYYKFNKNMEGEKR